MSLKANLNLSGPGPRPGPGPLQKLMTWAAVAWLLFVPSTAALAHGVEITSGTSQAAWIRAGYAGGEPMAFAKARVLDPQGQTYQVGNADALGRFAWLPDRPGQWQVAVEDGMGHRGELTINADQAGSPQQAQAADDMHDIPQIYRVVWGLSLIFWLSGLSFWWRGRRRRVHPGSRK